MASVIKKADHKLPENHPLARKFDTAEEGAKAKADYVMNTVLKDFDWDAFMVKKQAQASKQ
ncbi:hypothetical protein [Spirosoma sp. KUDC1026]|jgi:hypothetical protein|uniref:hypothetical protein n=1 Tax=Spirosoma sp. KUDC1026 TaxID=2745947 RepID=UPI00159BD556|nr:hypothetical protein [Spirosoma sp. KUDC1026]QKZ14673.1 hypothetical protein HU175_19385 [Spirosoma sp. KUDC1026]